MTREEFVTWQAFLRRHPRGLRWDNWVQATLVREINRSRPRSRGARLPKLADFLYQPPVPLMVERERAEARKKRKEK